MNRSNTVRDRLYRGGIRVSTEILPGQSEKAFALLKEDADKIVKLIEVQMKNLTMPQCPLYEEVLDTQMFGLSREIDFAIRLQLVSEEEGRRLLSQLEQQLSSLHEATMKARGGSV
nr:YlaN family protein [Alkalicoccus luteus]